jgi:glycosyltransferase involved in cell wall biosynthesis
VRLCSVIIPVWNGARHLDATLASVFAQDHRPIEVIVVDDGSTDETPELCARWSEAIYLRQARQGVATARNAGLARARGDYLALQDADDLWAPHKLRVQLAHLEAHPEHGYVVAQYLDFLEPGTPRPPWVRERDLVEPRIGGIGNLMMRRSVLDRVPTFDPDDPSDLGWSLRAREAGIGAGVVPEVLLRRRIHVGNASHALDGEQIRLRALRAAILRRREARGDDP